MIEVEKIKQLVSIVDVANSYGCEPVKKGGIFVLKNNPVRDDGKISSFTLYPDSNKFYDFGGTQEKGDVINLVQILENCDFKEAINIIEEKFLRTQVITAPKKEQNLKLNEEQVKNLFRNFKAIDLTVKAQKDHIKTIMPEWLPTDSDEDDWAYFLSISKWCSKEQSMVFKMPSFEKQYLTYKFRYRKFSDGVRKWVALAQSRADYLYCNLKHDNNIVLVVEGTRDFITAFLCGYNVIALPRANYNKDFSKILQDDKTYIFIDDDDEKAFMKPLFDESKCTKIYFNHKKFKEITNCKSKDFSDYLYQFESLKHFKIMFDEFIQDSLNLDWKDLLFNVTKPLTIEQIKKAQNQEFLYPELIIKQNITMVVSPPNTGKSALVFGLSQSLLVNNDIDNVFFLDPDSNVSYVKEVVEKMINEYGEKFNYYNGVESTVQQMIQLLETMSTLPRGKGSKSLIICDGLQFFGKGAIGDDTTTKDFLELLKLVRDRFGATIIVLHHTKKDKDDKGNYDYIGSQFIEAATDNMILLNAKNKKLMAFVKKSRSDKKGNVYSIDIDFKERKIIDVEFVKNVSHDTDDEDEEDEQELEVNEENIKKFMRGKDWVTNTDINKHFKATRKSRKGEKEKMDAIFTILRECQEIEWNGELGKKSRNRLIDNAPKEVTFQSDGIDVYVEDGAIDVPTVLL